jgi:hypothetical protein
VLTNGSAPGPIIGGQQRGCIEVEIAWAHVCRSQGRGVEEGRLDGDSRVLVSANRPPAWAARPTKTRLSSA